MDRTEWLKKKRITAERRYDVLWAPIYDENWGSEIDPVHERYVTQVVEACPPDGLILDAACGTGKYWPILLESGRQFVGVDQSQGMLDIAVSKHPQVEVHKLGLQEIQYINVFNLILCMDAMENVFPEDWPLVLGNFYRALKPDGRLYFTVEVAEKDLVDREYQKATQMDLPVVYGEAVMDEKEPGKEAGYHYYPSMDQVRTWLDEACFTILEETESGWYHHFWVAKGDGCRGE